MTLIRCQVRDLQALDLSSLTSRRMTPEGYLVAPATLAMAGNIQKYAARELGLDKSHGMDGDRMVSLYRPAAEVFRADTIKSFDGQPLTLDHPPAGVNAANYTSVNRGDVRDIHGAGDRMKGTIWVRDAAAVAAVTGGKSQLSCGYDFDLDLTAGTAADGSAYDGTMKNIVGNHLAIVDYARGGPGCRIGDKQPGEKTMATKIIDGVSIEFANDTGGSFVERLIADLRSKITAGDAATTAATERATKAETALVAMGEAGKKLAADHATKVAELEAKQVNPEMIQVLAAERSKVCNDAALMAKDLKTDGRTVGQIRVDVLTAVIAKDAAAKKLVTAILGADAAMDKPENAPLVRAAFDAVVAARGTAAATSGNDGFGRALAHPLPADGTGGAGTSTAQAQDSAGGGTAPLPEVGTVFESDKVVGREARMAADATAWQPKRAPAA